MIEPYSPSASYADEYLLLREFTHRVKNELASALGFISLTAARSEQSEVKSALARVSDHLYGYAQIYSALQAPTSEDRADVVEYLSTLCEAICQTKLRHQKIELAFIADGALPLPTGHCWRLGLVVSELITNSAKHAFAGGAGSIRVRLCKRGMFVECSVGDNGCTKTQISPGHGIGIAQALVRGLGGTVRQSTARQGTAVVVTLPIADARAGSQRASATRHAEPYIAMIKDYDDENDAKYQ